MNPFEHPILQEQHGEARMLKRLAVHLFNASVHCDMGAILRGTQYTRELALFMCEHYARHGESCPVFMRVARALVDEVLGPEEVSL